MYEIILTDKGAPYTTPPIVVNDYIVSNGYLEIPTYMFSGWNLTCGLNSIDNYKNYINITDNTPDKVKYYKSLPFSENDQVTYVDNYIVTIGKNSISLIDFENDLELKYNMTDVVGISSANNGKEQVFYVISNKEDTCELFLISNNTIPTKLDLYLKRIIHS